MLMAKLVRQKPPNHKHPLQLPQTSYTKNALFWMPWMIMFSKPGLHRKPSTLPRITAGFAYDELPLQAEVVGLRGVAREQR